jgi:hypothetical protein
MAGSSGACRKPDGIFAVGRQERFIDVFPTFPKSAWDYWLYRPILMLAFDLCGAVCDGWEARSQIGPVKPKITGQTV